MSRLCKVISTISTNSTLTNALLTASKRTSVGMKKDSSLESRDVRKKQV